MKVQTHLLNLIFLKEAHQHPLFHNTEFFLGKYLENIHFKSTVQHRTQIFKAYHIKTKQQQFCLKKLTSNQTTQNNPLQNS